MSLPSRPTAPVRVSRHLVATFLQLLRLRICRLNLVLILFPVVVIHGLAARMDLEGAYAILDCAVPVGADARYAVRFPPDEKVMLIGAANLRFSLRAAADDATEKRISPAELDAWSRTERQRIRRLHGLQ